MSQVLQLRHVPKLLLPGKRREIQKPQNGSSHARVLHDGEFWNRFFKRIVVRHISKIICLEQMVIEPIRKCQAVDQKYIINKDVGFVKFSPSKNLTIFSFIQHKCPKMRS
jgi:hypothetical protein